MTESKKNSRQPPTGLEEKPVMDVSDDEATASESSVSQEQGRNYASPSSDEDIVPMLDFRSPTEWISFFCGVVLIVLAGPPVGIVVFCSMIWEALDRRFDGGFVDSGRELTGFLFTKFIPWVGKKTQAFNERFVKRSDDAYMMNCIVAYGGLIPVMFFACAWWAYHSDTKMTPISILFVYHLIRIGPYFMNFAYVYTLCHKEGHSYAGLYSTSYNDSILLRNVFNWWIGMFYGVLPATFAYGHSINHHRYNNGPLDVISTSDKPRDNFFNWIAYLPRYFLYAINVSTVYQFACEENWKVVYKVIFGSVWFISWLLLNTILISPTFALAFVAFPFFEACLLLAAVNWSWHAFLEPTEPSNEYVQSITILDGLINVLNEDSHVVHHQYPGAHWTDHPTHMNKVWEQYIDNRASVFRGTHAFEVFGMAVARDYEALAKKFVDLKGERDGNPLTHSEKVDLMKERLRGCWWGPRVMMMATPTSEGADTKEKVN